MLTMYLVFSVPIAKTFHTLKEFLNIAFHNVKCNRWIPPPTTTQRPLLKEFHCSLSLLQGHHSDLPQTASSVGSPVF